MANNMLDFVHTRMMVAVVGDMVPGRLRHFMADAHIYDRHVDIIRELIARPEHPAPKVWLNPEVKDFYAFTTEDLHVEGYETEPQIRDIPIAV